MRTIWKYELGQTSITRLQIPLNAEILSLQIDGKTNIPCLWILVNSDNPQEERVFEQFGTGHNVPFNTSYDQKYIGTYQQHGGEFVGHFFEQISI